MTNIRQFYNNFINAWGENINSEDYSKKAFVANEWLAEVLSQPDLVRYLNSIPYNETNILLINDNQIEEKKSIFSKIVDFLLDLFLGNHQDAIQKGNVLDQINRLIKLNENNNTTNLNNTQTTKENIEQIVNNVNEPGTLPVEGIQLNLFDEETPDNDINDDADFNILNDDGLDIQEDYDVDNLSVINPISNEDIFENSNGQSNPNGIMRAPSMKQFEQVFRTTNRSLVASEIAENRIKYQCKL